MALAEPRNRPTPIVPPMAMSWIWRLRRLRARLISGWVMAGSFAWVGFLKTDSAARWPEEGIAAPLRQLVALHDRRRTGSVEAGGDTLRRRRPAGRPRGAERRDPTSGGRGRG